jgi:hypothetical protein
MNNLVEENSDTKEYAEKKSDYRSRVRIYILFSCSYLALGGLLNNEGLRQNMLLYLIPAGSWLLVTLVSLIHFSAIIHWLIYAAIASGIVIPVISFLNSDSKVEFLSILILLIVIRLCILSNGRRGNADKDGINGYHT